MKMTIDGLRLVHKKPYIVTPRNTYGVMLTVNMNCGLEAGDQVLQYSTEGGDVVVLKRVKKGAR